MAASAGLRSPVLEALPTPGTSECTPVLGLSLLVNAMG